MKSILIIGSGVIGLSTAYYCAKRGHQVTVLDRSPEQRDGCSFGNAGMVVPSHFVPLAAPGMVALGLKWMWNPESPFYVKPRLSWDLVSWGWKFWRAATPAHVERSAPLLRDLGFASRDCFAELATLPDNEFGLVQKGLVMLCKTPHALEEETRLAARAKALGVPAEVLDPAALARLEPDIAMDVSGGVYFPQDCHLSPNRFMAALKEQCARLGVKFLWETEVACWWPPDGERLDSVTCAGPGGAVDLSPDEFVICGGSWSPVVARDLGLRIPMQAGKGYSLTLTKPPQLPRTCAIFCEARVAVTPIGNSLRFGGTMEIAGLNEEINPVRVQGIIKSVPRYYPKFTAKEFESVQPWRGLRPCSPDGLPYVGRTAKYSNLSIATGHAMMGLSLGPITGQLMSEILSDEEPSIDIQLLHPDRYA